jgi:hypothetical protein
MSSSSSSLSVQIPFVQVGESHVTFSILSSKGDATWQVKRRYNDFIKLQTAVRKQVGKDVELPELPPKAVRLGLSKFDPDFIEGRRAGLEAYLIKLVSVVDPERAEALDDFLDYAEHWLKEAVSLLGDVKELQSIVKMLKQAADTAALVHQRRSGLEGGGGSGGKAGSKRRGSDDDDDDDRSSAPNPSPSSSFTVDGPDLVAVLNDVVRMMTDYHAMLRSQAEDADERSEATSASNSALTAKLRGKNEDIADALEMVNSLRQSRLRECAKERLQLQVVAQQVRTVAAELRRVVCEGNSVRNAFREHTSALTMARGGLIEWEKASLPGNNNNNVTAILSPSSRSSLNNGASSSSSSSTTAMLSLSPLEQVSSLVTRAEDFKNEADVSVRNLSAKGLSIPKAGSDEAVALASSSSSSFSNNYKGSHLNEDGGNSSSSRRHVLSSKASHLMEKSVLSGPNLGIALLLQAVSLDSADLIECAQQIADGKLVPKPNETSPKQQQQQQQQKNQGSGGGLASNFSAGTTTTTSNYRNNGSGDPISTPKNPFQASSSSSGGPPDFGGLGSTSSSQSGRASTTSSSSTSSSSTSLHSVEANKSPGNPFGGGLPTSTKSNTTMKASSGNPF